MSDRLGHAHPTSAADPLEGVATRSAAARPNQRWSIDFVSDCAGTGKVIRMSTMVDVDRVAAERDLPEAIVLDNGPEFRGRGLAAWSEERGVRLEFIQPGKPVQDAYVESFNGRLRDECSICTYTSGDAGMKRASTWMLEQGTQTPPAPDVIPAENERLNLTGKLALGLVQQTGTPHILSFSFPPIAARGASLDS